jgi:3-hydroxyisobutyrate dehydrogenase-like beta-hydroxyacid dehydrogenase
VTLPSIALIGFGEVGQTLAADLQARGIDDLIAWDRLFTDPQSPPARAARSAGIAAAHGLRAAVAGRDIVVSAVTAAECVAVATEAAPALRQDAFFVDLNSAAPSSRSAAATVIGKVGGRYVELAVMSPIAPRRSASPMLAGGPHAAAFLPLGRALGFTGIELFAEDIGRASAAKMCRSVMVKGMEALLAESLLAARRYGVEDAVIASLQDLFPMDDWRSHARYMVSRSLLHGRRRAEEMREAARTVADAGLSPWMSEACAERQDWASGHAAALRQEQLGDMLDAMLAATPSAAAPLRGAPA